MGLWRKRGWWVFGVRRGAVIGLGAGLLWVCASVQAGLGLPGELMAQLPQPWPPRGWSNILTLPSGKGHRAQPHRSEPQTREGYFGQTLYHQPAPPTQGYWTANILILDRGDRGAAWRAVSAIHRCPVRIHRGQRARECRHETGPSLTKTLHYQVERFYVTIQVRGPGEIGYPEFELIGFGMDMPF